MKRFAAIWFLSCEFCKNRKVINLQKLLVKTLKYSTSELCRIADAIDRFGLDNLI